MYKIIDEDIDKKRTDFNYHTAPVNGDDIFDTSTLGGFSFIAQAIPGNKDEEYMKRVKNRVGKIEQMSPQEYYNLAAKGFNTTAAELKRQRGYSRDYIEELKDVILEKKVKFPMTFIDLTSPGSQEGLHRMYAAAELFGWDHKFPVLIVDWYDKARHEREVKEDQDYQTYQHIDAAVNQALRCVYYSIDEFKDQLGYELNKEYYGYDEEEHGPVDFDLKQIDNNTYAVVIGDVEYKFDKSRINLDVDVDLVESVLSDKYQIIILDSWGQVLYKTCYDSYKEAFEKARAWVEDPTFNRFHNCNNLDFANTIYVVNYTTKQTAVMWQKVFDDYWQFSDMGGMEYDGEDLIEAKEPDKYYFALSYWRIDKSVSYKSPWYMGKQQLLNEEDLFAELKAIICDKNIFIKYNPEVSIIYVEQISNNKKRGFEILDSGEYRKDIAILKKDANNEWYVENDKTKGKKIEKLIKECNIAVDLVEANLDNYPTKLKGSNFGWINDPLIEKKDIIGGTAADAKEWNNYLKSASDLTDDDLIDWAIECRDKVNNTKWAKYYIKDEINEMLDDILEYSSKQVDLVESDNSITTKPYQVAITDYRKSRSSGERNKVYYFSTFEDAFRFANIKEASLKQGEPSDYCCVEIVSRAQSRLISAFEILPKEGNNGKKKYNYVINPDFEYLFKDIDLVLVEAYKDPNLQNLYDSRFIITFSRDFDDPSAEVWYAVIDGRTTLPEKHSLDTGYYTYNGIKYTQDRNEATIIPWKYFAQFYNKNIKKDTCDYFFKEPPEDWGYKAGDYIHVSKVEDDDVDLIESFADHLDAIEQAIAKGKKCYIVFSVGGIDDHFEDKAPYKFFEPDQIQDAFNYACSLKIPKNGGTVHINLIDPELKKIGSGYAAILQLANEKINYDPSFEFGSFGINVDYVKPGYECYLPKYNKNIDLIEKKLTETSSAKKPYRVEFYDSALLAKYLPASSYKYFMTLESAFRCAKKFEDTIRERKGKDYCFVMISDTKLKKKMWTFHYRPYNKLYNIKSPFSYEINPDYKDAVSEAECSYYDSNSEPVDLVESADDHFIIVQYAEDCYGASESVHVGGTRKNAIYFIEHMDEYKDSYTGEFKRGHLYINKKLVKTFHSLDDIAEYLKDYYDLNNESIDLVEDLDPDKKDFIRLQVLRDLDTLDSLYNEMVEGQWNISDMRDVDDYVNLIAGYDYDSLMNGELWNNQISDEYKKYVHDKRLKHEDVYDMVVEDLKGELYLYRKTYQVPTFDLIENKKSDKC